MEKKQISRRGFLGGAHLLMKGVIIRQVQQYLGHKRLETIMIYTHVIPQLVGDADSPLDTL